MKQYAQYNLISIFKMNTRKRTDKRKYPKMINTCVNRAIGNGFTAVKLYFSKLYLFSMYKSHIRKISSEVFFPMQ